MTDTGANRSNDPNIKPEWLAAPGAASPVDYETYGTIYYPKNVPPASSLVHHEPTLEEAYPIHGHIGDPDHPVEKDRYHLYISWACPIAHRSAITRKLLGLEDVVTLSVVDPLRDGRGWAFREVDGATLDTAGNGFAFLREAYDQTVGGTYEHRISVPVLWDKKTKTIVSNYYPVIPRELAKLREFAEHPEVDLYPESLRSDIDETERWIGEAINGGPYDAGFARTQADYEFAEKRFFDAIERVDGILTKSRFLFGDELTEADINLWTSLYRWWTVYEVHFKLNRHNLLHYANVARFVKELYRLDAFRSTTNTAHIKWHYYNTQRPVNPNGIVPEGPSLDWLDE
ncbi:glutathione-dependent reductase [Bifidobacterium rousetti]|uniref:glutathione S-transferase C-terminal domain-containing protein n=1 Tax=Bifidobacterium rousetti TaxID=2045439 RepID=UPI00123849BF|nr:glutathione S-transferase C-terminal domain-containing protein [Bifidobacterium rousetti]KAA8819425.1 glutathione-dependent reductase [Bifidobacterium rousetti]